VIVLLGVEVCFVSQHFDVLSHKRKHLQLSRSQHDALAFLILTEVTLAFRGRRRAVTIEEWSHKYGVPPGNLVRIVESLREGGLLERTGRDRNEILLTRDPDFIRISYIDDVLSGEKSTDWDWPADASWGWLKDWMMKRQETLSGSISNMTLGRLVSEIVDVGNGEDTETAKSVGKVDGIMFTGGE